MMEYIYIYLGLGVLTLLLLAIFDDTPTLERDEDTAWMLVLCVLIWPVIAIVYTLMATEGWVSKPYNAFGNLMKNSWNRFVSLVNVRSK